MAKHNLLAETLAKLEEDRKRLLAAHEALPAIRAAAQMAHDAVSAAEAGIEALLNSIALAGFHGLDIKEEPVKMSATPKATPPTVKQVAVSAAKDAGMEKLKKS